MIWLFWIITDEPCELYCTDSDDTMILPFGDAAADGTPCNIGSNDMCIGKNLILIKLIFNFNWVSCTQTAFVERSGVIGWWTRILQWTSVEYVAVLIKRAQLLAGISQRKLTCQKDTMKSQWFLKVITGANCVSFRLLNVFYYA